MAADKKLQIFSFSFSQVWDNNSIDCQFSFFSSYKLTKWYHEDSIIFVFQWQEIVFSYQNQ